MSFKKIYMMMWKDLTMELRSKETVSAMLIFSILVIVIFGFAFIQPSGKIQPEVFPGVMWVAITFAGILGLNRSFLLEKHNDSLMGLMLAPIDKSVIFFGKVLANFIFLLMVELISMPLFLIFLNLQIKGPVLYLILVIFLGTLGFIAIGTFLSALAANTKASEILLPIILFPILVPLILGAVKATGIVISGFILEPGWAQSFWSWIRLMAVYDIIFLVVPFLLFEYVLEV